MKGFTLVWVLGKIRASVQELWRGVPDDDRSRLLRKSNCDRNHDENSG